MAGETQQTTPAATQKAEPEAEKFSREDLIERAHTLFDVDPHTLAGALSFSGANRTHWTEAEVGKLIKRFQGNKVSADPTEDA